MVSPYVNHGMAGVVSVGAIEGFSNFSSPGGSFLYFHNGTAYSAEGQGIAKQLHAVPAGVPLRIKLDTTATPHRVFFAHGASGWVHYFSVPAGEYLFAACLNGETGSLTLGTCPL